MQRFKVHPTRGLIAIDESGNALSDKPLEAPMLDTSNCAGFQAFKSPVDGGIVRNKTELREHNNLNGVVDAREFSGDYYEKKAKERAKVFTGERTTRETFERKQEINSIIDRLSHGD